MKQDKNISGLIFSDRLRSEMSKKGLTQVQLAEHAGVSQGSVSGWLNGAVPKADKLIKIAELLGVSQQWLLTGREPPEVPSRQSPYETMKLIVANAAGEEVSARILGRYADLMDKAKNGNDASLRQTAEETLYFETAMASELSLARERLENFRVKLGDLLKEL